MIMTTVYIAEEKKKKTTIDKKKAGSFKEAEKQKEQTIE